jgi:hypothetical protein
MIIFDKKIKTAMYLCIYGYNVPPLSNDGQF